MDSQRQDDESGYLSHDRNESHRIHRYHKVRNRGCRCVHFPAFFANFTRILNNINEISMNFHWNFLGVSIGGRHVQRTKISTFPGFLRKTDQDRIQGHPDYISRFADVEFEITEKLEGSSITAFFKYVTRIFSEFSVRFREISDVYSRGVYGVCSRNQLLNIEDMTSAAVKTLHDLGVPDIFKNYGQNIALQGYFLYYWYFLWPKNVKQRMIYHVST